MDVSILQHSQDSSPQQVAVAEVVKLIRGSQWPPGYQPLLIAGSVVQGERKGGSREGRQADLERQDQGGHCGCQGVFTTLDTKEVNLK